MLCTKSLPLPPPPLILNPLPCLSDFRRPYSFGVGQSTHTSFYLLLKPSKLRQWPQLQNIYWSRVTGVLGHLYMLMDTVYKIHPKERVFRKGLVVFSIKAVNLMRPRRHREAKWDLINQVVAWNLENIPCGVPELLCWCEDMDPLVQHLAWFFLCQAIISHRQEELYPHCPLLGVCGSYGWGRGEERR